MIPRTIDTDAAPTPLAFYSQGVVWDDVAWLAGQIASDYVTGVPDEARRPVRLADGTDIAEQTRYVLRNLAGVAEAGGTDLRRCVKANVFLKRASDFAGFDAVWREVFGDDPPPRTTVVVGGHGLLVPGTLVEIDPWAAGISQPATSIGGARRCPAPMRRPGSCRGSSTAPAGWRSMRAGRCYRTPGWTPPSPSTPSRSSGRPEPSSRSSRRSSRAGVGRSTTWCGAARSSRTCTTPISSTRSGENVFGDPPARTVVQAGGLLAEDARVEIELVAVPPDRREELRRIRLPGSRSATPDAVVAGTWCSAAA